VGFIVMCHANIAAVLPESGSSFPKSSGILNEIRAKKIRYVASASLLFKNTVFNMECSAETVCKSEFLTLTKPYQISIFSPT